jgi:hypothetical protein
MATLEDILNNKDSYPDTTKITLADGVETTLGDLRKNTMLERDYRQKTAALAAQRRNFEQKQAEWEAARLDAEAKLTELAKQLFAQNPMASRDEIDEMLERDPIARKLSERLQSLEAKLTEADQRVRAAEAKQQMYETAYIADQHRRVLSFLKQQDPDLNEEELVQFARANYIPRLDWAHKLMTEERRTKTAIEAAKKEAHEAAYKKAKEELLQPAITARRVVAAPSKDTPATFDEAADRALQDPEILQILQPGG